MLMLKINIPQLCTNSLCLQGVIIQLSFFSFLLFKHPLSFRFFFLLQIMKHQQQLEFNQGVMKLSAYDPSSKKYETRILRLPEVPFLEPLEYLINNETNKPLRLTKSCNNKRINNHTSTITLTPRRCQSNPNLYKKQQSYQNNGKYIYSKTTM